MELPSPTAYSKRRPKAPVLKGRVLDLGADEIPLYSGALHYWRIERRFWRRTLEAVRNLGLDTVETYIPWGVHEQADGTFDFGERHERLDVGAFLELVSELGMYAIVRPGPHINAELTYFGLPERVVHDPECQARSPRRNPVIQPFPPRMFPAPSYASRKYHEEVGRWFDAVGQVVGPHLWPRGAVVLTQVDNEGTFFFRNGPYDQDYHRDAIDRFRAFLEERYGTVAALNEAYRRVYSSFGDVPPPERFDAHEANELVPHLDWAAFHEHLIGDALARMRQRLHDAGVREVPTIHNIPLGETGLPVSIPSIARVVDLVGLDYYHPAREHRVVKRRTAYLAGTFDFAYSPELGVGAPPWFTPLSHHDSLTVAMTAAAYGLRGFNLYMAVDRDRWYGAPIDARGELRTEASAWRRWVQAMRRVRFHTLDRRAEVALVVPNEYRRLSRATHLFGGIASPSSVEAIGGTP
ncbi:MAG: beta-galactosidase, partial [Myxococcales bacterium]|nr:beta-galactosidase [Myxococcales bacterium]